jgi:hypothetical protein
MPHTLFFSWQSDTPPDVGSELIEEALRSAITALAEDAKIEKAIRDEGLMLDRDTQGVPGVPPIVDTIFDKIDHATIFVPDLTFVGNRIDGRPTPNPNVLVEYGWALKALGHTRIVPVMNVAFGEPTPATMPFDMRHLRNPKCTYNLPAGASDEQRRDELGRLAHSLAAEIGAVLRSEDLRTKDPVHRQKHISGTPALRLSISSQRDSISLHLLKNCYLIVDRAPILPLYSPTVLKLEPVRPED